MARIKTRYIGVYYRYAKSRVMADGKPDKCYDIHYKANGRYIWEKIGWRSEGYTIQDAITIRGMRVKALRHPELVQQETVELEYAQLKDKDKYNSKIITISDLWKRYFEYCLPYLKNKKTILSIYSIYIAPRMAQKTAENICPLDIEKFKISISNSIKRDGKKISKAYVNHIISFLGRLINKGMEWGIVNSKNNPVKNVYFADADNERERFLTKNEASRLLDGLEFTSCEVYFAAKISLYSGLRLSEVANLEKENIDIEEKIIYINGKTGRRYAYIADDIIEIFSFIKKNTLNKNDPKKCFGIGLKCIYSVFSNVVRDIGFNNEIKNSNQKVVFHTLRHTFCSWLAMKGVPLYTIGELAGHKSLEMTKRYAKLSPDYKRDALKNLKKIID